MPGYGGRELQRRGQPPKATLLLILAFSLVAEYDRMIIDMAAEAAAAAPLRGLHAAHTPSQNGRWPRSHSRQRHCSPRQGKAGCFADAEIIFMRVIFDAGIVIRRRLASSAADAIFHHILFSKVAR